MADWVAGRIPVLECLRAKRRPVHRLHIVRNSKGLELIFAAAGSIPIRECDRRDLDDRLAGFVHQGVAAEVDPLPLFPAREWVSRLDSGPGVVVVLDEIEDPHNFGAIVRSASACGAWGVMIGKHRSAPISPASSKSAAGAMEHIDLVQAGNVVRGLDILKKAGFWAVALDAASDTLLWNADLSGRIALVIGSEGKGLRRIVHETCDLHVQIPLSGPITSLNASVSAAVALIESMRQRRNE